ncbi:hypothetical protein BpHYR1_039296 [Brachionus plicatilis]|uniref:Uncharacterized protein n=1 Tax=Brachionus plicatilis TaxID=10195 RepID=A0A3M7RF16_BRAPC|nr:hypothetical protein BpHYR1_039296 [Brachionus plicatilis]
MHGWNVSRKKTFFTLKKNELIKIGIMFRILAKKALNPVACTICGEFLKNEKMQLCFRIRLILTTIS